MSTTQWIVESVGWIGSVLIVGAYYTNMRGRWQSSNPYYIWSNLLGGICFIINTGYHHAYPSVVVNIIWVIIAVLSLMNGLKKKHEEKRT